jgi:hypothetical protein
MVIYDITMRDSVLHPVIEQAGGQWNIKAQALTYVGGAIAPLNFPLIKVS